MSISRPADISPVDTYIFGNDWGLFVDIDIESNYDHNNIDNYKKNWLPSKKYLFGRYIVYVHNTEISHDTIVFIGNVMLLIIFFYLTVYFM